jgi:succinyl-CoA synthetase beta subunit
VEAGCDIRRELYLSLLVDRGSSRVVIMTVTESGMEIKEVAATHPEKIPRVSIDPAAGIPGFHARKLGFGLGLNTAQQKSRSSLTRCTRRSWRLIAQSWRSTRWW